MRLLGFREAAEFWKVAAEPELAFRLHALIGGAVEDKARCGGAGPGSLADFDDWVGRWWRPTFISRISGRWPGNGACGSRPRRR